MKVSKIIIYWSVVGALSGYFVLHPVVHIVAVLHIHTGRVPPTNIYHEILKAFSLSMLPWSLAFMILCAFIGVFWGKIRLADKEKSKIIVELHKALEEVKTLSGFLPICASCKKLEMTKATGIKLRLI